MPIFGRKKKGTTAGIAVEEVEAKPKRVEDMGAQEIEAWYQAEAERKALEKKVAKRYPDTPPRQRALVRGRSSGMFGAIGEFREKYGLFSGHQDPDSMGPKLANKIVAMNPNPPRHDEILLGHVGPREGVDYDRIYRHDLARAMGREKRKEIMAAANAAAKARIHGVQETPGSLLIGKARTFDGLGPEEMQIYSESVARGTVRGRGRKGKRTPPSINIPPSSSPPSLTEVADNLLLGGSKHRRKRVEKNHGRMIRFV
jgi:hypothetical protein